MKARTFLIAALPVALAATAGAWVYSQQTERVHAAATPLRAPASVSTHAPHADKAQMDKDDNEAPISFAELPEAVRAAVLKLTSEASITSILKEADKSGVSYEVQYTAGGKTVEIDVSAAGVVEDDDHEDADDGHDHDQNDGDNDGEDNND